MALLDEEKSKRDQEILDKRMKKARKESYLYLLKERLKNRDITKEKAKQALLDKDKSDDAIATSILAQAEAEEFKDQAKLKAEIAKIEGEIKQEEFEIKNLNIEQQKTSLEQLANTQGLFSVLGSVLGVLTPIFTVMQLINGAQLLFLKLKNKEPRAYAKSAVAAQKDTAAKSKGMFAGVVSAFSSLGVPGVIAGIALAVGLAAALGVGIAAAFGAFNVKDDSEKGAKKINDLSNEIYKLNEKAEAINNITESFDKLDNKLIKTKTDLEEINSLLEKGAESMDDSEVDKKDNIGYGKGKNEKEHYLELSDDEKKLYLERKEAELQSELDAKRQEQKTIIENMDDDAREKLFNETSTNAEVIKAQSAVYALNNAAIYKEIDALKEAGILTSEAAFATEQLTQSMLENITVSDA